MRVPEPSPLPIPQEIVTYVPFGSLETSTMTKLPVTVGTISSCKIRLLSCQVLLRTFFFLLSSDDYWLEKMSNGVLAFLERDPPNDDPSFKMNALIWEKGKRATKIVKF